MADNMKFNNDTEDYEVGVIPAVLGAIGVVLLIVSLFLAVFKVGEQEQAVITRFGKVVRTETAGLHFKVPFIDKATKVDTTTKGLPIGYRNQEESKSLFGAGTPAGMISVPEESLMITSDFNFVNVDFYLEYKISDAEKALYASDNPEAILRNLAQACIRTVVSNYTVDNVITTEKNKIQSDIKTMLVDELTKCEIGLSIVNLSMQDAEPPSAEIMTAFEAVEQERQNKETVINSAKKYANEKIPQAEAEYDRITQSALATKEARISEAQGQVSRFNNMYEEYVKYPEITKQRMFYETMSEILPKVDLIITDGTSETILPLDDFVSTKETE